jgi:hypothetical protein
MANARPDDEDRDGGHRSRHVAERVMDTLTAGQIAASLVPVHAPVQPASTQPARRDQAIVQRADPATAQRFQQAQDISDLVGQLSDHHERVNEQLRRRGIEQGVQEAAPKVEEVRPREQSNSRARHRER